MRLSTVANIGAAVAVAGLAATGAFAFRDALRPLLVSDETADSQPLRRTSRHLVYRIPPEGSLRFALSRPSRLIRITTQPNIDPQDWASDRTWIYGYRAILRDDDDRIVAEHDIFSRALHPDRLRPFKRPVRFHRNSDTKVALMDDAVIEAPEPVATVELVALGSDTGVTSLDARLFERVPFIGQTALSAFRRRTTEEQADLARADAFPLDMLSDAERSALMANRWKVVGPLGIAGEDYEVVIVYERPFEAKGEGG